MLTPTLSSTLRIRGLELSLHLGWEDKERSRQRKVLMDMEICFPEPPLACITDELKDTLCYAGLSKDIRAAIAVKHYRLIEHLCQEIYTLTKNRLPAGTRVKIGITKMPFIGGLKEGVCFEYGDTAS